MKTRKELAEYMIENMGLDEILELAYESQLAYYNQLDEEDFQNELEVEGFTKRS